MNGMTGDMEISKGYGTSWYYLAWSTRGDRYEERKMIDLDSKLNEISTKALIMARVLGLA